MFSRDNWKEIFQTIQKNKLRTFLSGFTVALGIFIFVALLGLGNGLKNTFKEFFGSDSTNVMYLYPGRTSLPYKGYKSGRSVEFDNSDIVDIEKNFSLFLEYVTPRISRQALISYRSESNNYSTQGVAPSNQVAEGSIIMKGRYLNDIDVIDRNKYAVIGRLIEKDLFKGKNSIGKFVDVGGSSFKVIGVFQDDGGDDEERVMFIPYTTRQLIEKNNDKVDEIVVGFRPEIGYEGAMAFDASLDDFLRQKKFINPADENGIYVRNVAEQMQQNQQMGVALQLIITFVAFGTIVAGIIGISNIMVFVVKERTKELGVRKALGATPSSVVSTILLESIFITTVSGFIGMIIGIAVLSSLGEILEDYFIKNPYIDMSVAVYATIILIVFGAVAGYVPARRAAKIKPIVALRDE